MDIVVAPNPENFKWLAAVADEPTDMSHRRIVPQQPFSIVAHIAGGEQVAIETELGRLKSSKGSTGFRLTMSCAPLP